MKNNISPKYTIHLWQICNNRLKIIDCMIFDTREKMEYIQNTVRKIALPLPAWREEKPKQLYYEISFTPG